MLGTTLIEGMCEPVGESVGAVTTNCGEPPAPGFSYSAVTNNAISANTAVTPQNAAIPLFVNAEFIAACIYLWCGGQRNTVLD